MATDDCFVLEEANPLAAETISRPAGSDPDFTVGS